MLHLKISGRPFIAILIQLLHLLLLLLLLPLLLIIVMIIMKTITKKKGLFVAMGFFARVH